MAAFRLQSIPYIFCAWAGMITTGSVGPPLRTSQMWSSLSCADATRNSL